MHDAGKIGHSDQFQKRKQYGRTICGHDRSDQCEHANRRKVDDEAHNVDADFGKTLHKVCRGFSLVTGNDDAESEKQCDDNDLEHCGAD